MIVGKEELKNGRDRIRSVCQSEIFAFLDSAKALVSPIFLDIEANYEEEGQGSQSLPVEEILTQNLEKYKVLVRGVLDYAVSLSESGEPVEVDFITAKLPLKYAKRLLQDLLKILVHGHDLLSDESLMFISQVGECLDARKGLLDTLIEQVQYEKRKEFTQMLKDLLTEDQCYWIALMLWNAIHVDNLVHPREYKYFENISALINFDQTKFYQLETDYENIENPPEQEFHSDLRTHIYKYIVEIVMIDEAYSSEEARFIQDIGELFGYDKMEQDQIIQPVATALMLRKSLFSY